MKQWFPTQGTVLARCFQQVGQRGSRQYAHITFDLWRSDYNLNDKGAEAVGSYYTAYVERWIERARVKEVPFPRKGVAYTTKPITHIGWTVLKEDKQTVVSALWEMLNNPDNLVELRS